MQILGDVTTPSRDHKPLLMQASHTPPPDVPAPRLHIQDKGSVCRYLNSLSADWNSIGTYLYIPHGSLKEIMHDYRTSKDCLLEMVAVWLTRNEPCPTWPALADAVQYVDQHIAEKIRTEKC